MPIKILYVEDNMSNIQLIQRSLTKIMHENLEFHLAQDGEEGIATAERILPDLIIMDLHMPGMDGLTAMKHLQANAITRQIPVVILTADVVSDIVSEAHRAGAAALLSKPVSMRILERTINNILFLDHNASSA